MNKLLIFGLLFLSACSDTVSTPQNDTVILYRSGEFKKSEVKKIGVYCSVAWYKSIEALALKEDGTIDNSVFKYKWTLGEFNSQQDKEWFAANCKEVK